MTMEYRNTISDKIKKFDKLQKSIEDADDMIVVLNEMIGRITSGSENSYAPIVLTIPGYIGHEFDLNVEQISKLKEFLSSYRSDMYECQEEI